MLNFYQTNGQNPKVASCKEASFDKKVNALIHYRVPVMDVDSLAGKEDRFLLLDAREKEEFDTSHLPNAQYAGYKKIDINDWIELDKTQPIVVYCSVGFRSEKIGKKLQKAGFTQVFNLYGGLFEWVNRSHGLADQANKVHTYNKKWSQWVFNDAFEKVW